MDTTKIVLMKVEFGVSSSSHQRHAILAKVKGQEIIKTYGLLSGFLVRIFRTPEVIDYNEAVDGSMWDSKRKFFKDLWERKITVV